MAEGKKSFILYADLIHVVKKLVLKDRENKTNYAGELFLHILEYINDNDPVPIDFIVEMAFEPIKQTLKRDLEKYNVYLDKQRINGAKGGRPKKNPTEPKKPKPLFKNPTEPKKPDNDSVSDSVNDTKKEYNYSLEREVLNQVAKLFDSKYYDSDAKKKKWLDTIRLLINNDGYSKDIVINAIHFARNDEFWKSNLLSIPALRKKNDIGVMKIDSILAKMPKQSKFPKATYQQILSEYKHEGISSEKFNSGEYHIINNKVKRVLTDDKGLYIRDIDTKNGTVTKLRL